MSADAPDQLMAFALGDNSWPPDPDEGWGEVKFSAEYSVDEQKPAGKDDPTIKNTGRKARKVTFTLRWTNRIDDAARAYLLAVSPVGANQGKAWEISHIDAELYNVDAVTLTTMGEITRTPGERTVTLGGISWIKKPVAKAGTGVKSADKPVEWHNAPVKGAGDHVTFTTSDGNHIDMGPGPVGVKTSDGNTIGGFGGPQAPAPEVPP